MMDTLAAILNLITPGCYMASIFLKHAYYTILIAKEQRKFLKFIWNSQLYQYSPKLLNQFWPLSDRKGTLTIFICRVRKFLIAQY